MERFFSKVDKNIILYSLQRKNLIKNSRDDLSPDGECLQVSSKKLKAGQVFKPHRHLPISRNTLKTQETWIILDGEIRAVFYDIDNSVYREEILKSGDCVVCYNAGHGFEVIEDNTILYEVKNGPYYGLKKDKEGINEDTPL
tara:strand:- start:486 stop:911 length:426 start_codon:yes stop_codon:yes gene_type:complete